MITDNDIDNDMYAKLFAQVAQSSLTQNETISTRGVFFMLLAIADSEGVVLGTDKAIARIINVTEDILAAALERLMSPDPESQSTAEEGRRVVRLLDTPGLLLVNYLKYRGIKNNYERREYLRLAQRRSREKKRLLALGSAGGLPDPQHDAENALAGQKPSEAGHPGTESDPVPETRKKNRVPDGTGGRRNKPESIEECLEIGKTLGIPEVSCRSFYLYHSTRAIEGMNGEEVWMLGTEKDRVPITNWVTMLKGWEENEARLGIGKRRARMTKKDQTVPAENAPQIGPQIDVSTTRVHKPQPTAANG